MAFTLYYHPLSSYCWKVLIALDENGTAFTPREVDFDDTATQAEFKALWPMEHMPVLHDAAREKTVAETSVIIEYLAIHYPGHFTPIPADPEKALEVRFWDRVFDNFVMTPMQRIVLDRIRPEGGKDPYGVTHARALLAKSYALLDDRMATREWAAGDAFSLADCAAMPALHYADRVAPFRDAYPALGRYLDRLHARPSVARVLEGAVPYQHLFPQE